MKSALLAAAAALPLETRSLPLETREDPGPDFTALTRSLEEVRSAVEAGDKKRADELKALQDRLDAIEVRNKRPVVDPDDTDKDEAAQLQRRAFMGFLRRGVERMAPDEARSLIVGDDTKGGYLAPSQFVAEVLKGVVEFSPVRQAARVGATSAGEVILPKRTGRPTASWVGETEDRTGTEASYGQLEIPINESACYVDVSLRLLEDSAINVEAEVASDLAEEFGRQEGEAFVVGDGVKKPIGLMSAEDLAYTPSGGASNFASSNPADALITLMYALPTAYRNRAAWMMNSNTIGAVRKFKDSTGQYLWQPPVQAGQPATLLGRPVVEAEDMDDVGANAFPIVFGDFNRAYRIYDRVALSIMRDPYTLATKGQVRFHARRRVGGAPVMAEAMRALKIATS